MHLVTIKPVLLGGIATRLLKVPAVVFAVTGLGYIFINRSLVAFIRRKFISILYSIAFKHKNKRIIFQNIEKFNKQKVSQVFPKAKQSDIGNQKIGTFMNDDYIGTKSNILKLVNNKYGFDFNLSDTASYVERMSKEKSSKPVVIGNVKK